MLATIDDDALVVDFLVPSTSLQDQALRVPFTLRARLLRSAPRTRSCHCEHWLASGAPVDVSLRRRGSVPIARVAESHHHLTLEVRSVAPPIAQTPEAAATPDRGRRLLGEPGRAGQRALSSGSG